MDGGIISPIKEPLELDEALSLIEEVAERPGDLKLGWLINHGWAAVPAEGAMHFNEQDAHRISDAMIWIGCFEIIAVATEPLENTTLCYRVPTSKEGLLEFSWECGSFYFVLVPRNRDFAIMCTADDYYLVAGPRSFVEQAVGCELKEARERFLKFAKDESWPEPVRQHFLSVARRYETFNGE
jgi:hypothetical protein